MNHIVRRVLPRGALRQSKRRPRQSTAKATSRVESTTGAVAVGLGEWPFAGCFREMPVP